MNVELLTRQEVAASFRVNPVTVTRWANAGKLTCIRTPGGERRYFAAEVRAILLGERLTPAQIRALRTGAGEQS